MISNIKQIKQNNVQEWQEFKLFGKCFNTRVFFLIDKRLPTKIHDDKFYKIFYKKFLFLILNLYHFN